MPGDDIVLIPGTKRVEYVERDVVVATVHPAAEGLARLGEAAPPEPPPATTKWTRRP